MCNIKDFDDKDIKGGKYNIDELYDVFTKMPKKLFIELFNPIITLLNEAAENGTTPIFATVRDINKDNTRESDRMNALSNAVKKLKNNKSIEGIDQCSLHSIISDMFNTMDSGVIYKALGLIISDICNEYIEITADRSEIESGFIDSNMLYIATHKAINNINKDGLKDILGPFVSKICAEYIKTTKISDSIITAKSNNNKVEVKMLNNENIKEITSPYLSTDTQMTPELNTETCIQCIDNMYLKCKRLDIELHHITVYVGADVSKQYTLNEILRMCKTTINASGIIYANVRDAIKYTNRVEIINRLSALINNYYIGDYTIEYVDGHETMIEKLRAISNHHRTKPVRKQAYDYILKHGSLKGFGKCKMEDAWSLDEHEDKFLDFCYVLMLIKSYNINTDRILDQIMGKGNCPDGLKSTLKYINDKDTAINKIKGIIEYRNIDCSKFSGKIRLFLNKTIKSLKSPNPTPVYMNNFYNYHNPPYSYNPYHTPYCYNYAQPLYTTTLYNAQAQESDKEEE